MKLGRITVRTKLALLLLVAMGFLAATRGLGLMQLGGYLDRMNSYTLSLDTLHQQLEAAQESRITDLRAGRADAVTPEAHDLKVRELRVQLQARRADADAMQQSERAIMYNTYVGMLLVVFVVGGGIYWLLMATVVRPLRGMAAVANVVAAGDLTTDIRVNSEDEIGGVMQALRDMNGSLSELIGKIRGISQSIGGSTDQIAAAGDSLSRHVETQTDFLQKTAATLRELAAAVTRNADKASRARELAASARDVAIKGGVEVGQAVDKMSSISASSQKVVDIVSIIDSITFQTNILALNAAVEAARAGEQGRGFAVVATEVRNLAQRSAAAAKEIKVLIGDSVAAVETGSKLVDEAGATMDDIVSSVARVTDIMSEITAASHEQEAGIEQINQAIGEMDSVTQQNAALVEEAAAAASSLREQAGNLAQAVAVFKLDAGQAPVKAAVRPIASAPAKKAAPAAMRLAKPKAAVNDSWEEF